MNERDLQTLDQPLEPEGNQTVGDLPESGADALAPNPPVPGASVEADTPNRGGAPAGNLNHLTTGADAIRNRRRALVKRLPLPRFPKPYRKLDERADNLADALTAAVARVHGDIESFEYASLVSEAVEADRMRGLLEWKFRRDVEAGKEPDEGEFADRIVKLGATRTAKIRALKLDGSGADALWAFLQQPVADPIPPAAATIEHQGDALGTNPPEAVTEPLRDADGGPSI